MPRRRTKYGPAKPPEPAADFSVDTFDGQLERKTFCLIGRMWERHKDIENRLHKSDAFVVQNSAGPGAASGVYLVIADSLLEPVGTLGLSYTLKSVPVVTGIIRRWIEHGSTPLAENHLRAVLEHKWNFAAAQREQAARLQDACRETLEALNEAIGEDE